MSLDVASPPAMPSVFHLIRNILKGHKHSAETGRGRAPAADAGALQGPGISSPGEASVYWPPLKKLPDFREVI